MQDGQRLRAGTEVTIKAEKWQRIFFKSAFDPADMFTMSSDDFSVHMGDCNDVADGIPLSDLPDEVTSVKDLTCDCWNEFDSLDEIE